MSKVVPVNGKIIIERNDKLKKKGDSSNPFFTGATSNNLGVVKYSSDEKYPVGSSVYFGSEGIDTIMIDGVEVLAMKSENLIAKVSE